MIKERIGKILGILMVSLLIFTSSVSAVELLDSATTGEVYKLSEDKSSFNLPFFRFSSQRMELDKELSQFGAFCSNSSVELTQKQEGVQFIFATDTVRLNATTQYPVIASKGNVIVNGDIENTAIVFSQDTITITEDANVKGNLICYAKTIQINGKVDGNILGSISNLKVNSELNGQIRVNTSNVEFSENAKVLGGMVINTTTENLKVPEYVGETKIDVIKQNKVTFKARAIRALTLVLTDIAIYILLLMIVKKENLSKLSTAVGDGKNVIKKGMLGILTMILSVCFGVVLIFAVSKVAIAGIIFGIAFAIVVALIKNIVFGTFVVELVKTKYESTELKTNSIVTMIITFVLLEVLCMIPYVGIVVGTFVYVMSTGIIVSLVFRNTKGEDDENVKSDETKTMDVK